MGASTCFSTPVQASVTELSLHSFGSLSVISSCKWFVKPHSQWTHKWGWQLCSASSRLCHSTTSIWNITWDLPSLPWVQDLGACLAILKVINQLDCRGLLCYVWFFGFQITMEAMKSEVDEVALQGIEFWSNVCDEEVDLAIEASEVRKCYHVRNCFLTADKRFC